MTMSRLREEYSGKDNATKADDATSSPNKLRTALDDTIGSSLEAAQTIALCAQHQKRIGKLALCSTFRPC